MSDTVHWPTAWTDSLQQFVTYPTAVPRNQLLAVYRSMFLGRAIDQAKADLVARGEAFFHIPCNGHEGSAVLNLHLLPDDWLHVHYRDKALLMARGVTAEAFMHSLLCNTESHSAGRQMCGMMSSPPLHVLSTPTVVGNSALQSVGVASVLKERSDKAIMVCSMGDGTTQQGEVLEAIAEAVRWELPVLFFIEDNGLAISTRTEGRTFFSLPWSSVGPPQFYGLPIHRLDGRQVDRCIQPLGAIVGSMRRDRRPALVVFEVDRLDDHTNADDQRQYRDETDIDRCQRESDPLANLRRRLIADGHPTAELEQLERLVEEEVRQATTLALEGRQPQPAVATKLPLSEKLCRTDSEYRGHPSGPRLTMLEAIREVLRQQMLANPQVSLYGQDIEDPKGDVFGLTRGLSSQFPQRVVNSALSESTIVGTSIGRALVGERPVAFLQFADFLPLALNQMMSELGSMYWRTDGQWQCPVIIMAACGGYRPGLGPFHSQTFEALAAHVPGIDIFMPSSAADAAGLLNAAFESGRPTLFLYPKVCLNDRDATTSTDVSEQRVPIGRARLLTRGEELTIVAWGNTLALCRKATEALVAAGASVELIDLRTISPWDRQAVCESVARTGKLLVVHEDSLTCGFGAEIAATVAENVAGPTVVRRVTRPDTYVPFNFTNQLEILPSFRRILTVAAQILDFDLDWKPSAVPAAGLLTIEALGSSPADQNVSVVTWKVAVGDAVKANDSLADMEADKAVFELISPVDGTIEEILVREGSGVPIHTPILRIRTREATNRSRQLSREEPNEPILKRRRTSPARSSGKPLPATIGMSLPFVVTGSNRLSNDDLAARFSPRTPHDILQRTGIEVRPHVAPTENVLTMAVEAARRSLEDASLQLADLDSIICSTTTPLEVVPSLACRVHRELSKGGPAHHIPCYDILAACTGYLYALLAGFDLLQSRPQSRVLVLTAEAMSRVTNPDDFDTAILFGDAASATILYGAEAAPSPMVRLYRPIISASGDDGSVLHVPAPGCGCLKMDGKKVFTEAVRHMAAMLSEACREANIAVTDLDWIVPHQANGRIIEAIRTRLRLPPGRVVNQIRQFGNTSSTSIPLCLADLIGSKPSGKKLGLCAFGGGFTFGAAVIEHG